MRAGLELDAVVTVVFPRDVPQGGLTRTRRRMLRDCLKSRVLLCEWNARKGSVACGNQVRLPASDAPD